jgi:hypothetical protein
MSSEKHFSMSIPDRRWEVTRGNGEDGCVREEDMNTPMFLQYATDEPFLNGELAKQYVEMVSEPKKVKIHDAPHASAFSRSNSRSNRRTARP